jgi:hypothetical protein
MLGKKERNKEKKDKSNCPSSGGVLHKQLTVFHRASSEEYGC